MFLPKVLPPGDEYDLVQRKSDLYTNRAEAIWESRSASTGPVKDIKELPAYEKLAQEAQVIGSLGRRLLRPSDNYRDDSTKTWI